MFKTPQEYAKMLFDLHFQSESGALAEVFGAAKAYPEIPHSFWRDVFLAIQVLATNK